MSKNILITGESGFIGSHLLRCFINKYPDYMIHGLDSLTYASNRIFNQELEQKNNYKFHKIDIRNRDEVIQLFEIEKYTDVIHLAAESHVDNSIENPLIFAETNVLGTLNLLDAFRKFSNGRFHHVSTDEVYGDLKINDPAFEETTSYSPSSPYSASKAASDHFVRAYYRTYGIDATITNCSNNFGPHQHREKFIPTIIQSIIEGRSIPIYGKGENIRDWLYVQDHVGAIDKVFHEGASGATYNVGGDNELTNIDLVYKICDIMLNKGYCSGNPRKLISFIKDREGHDLRYAINSQKLNIELEWAPKFKFLDVLSSTIDWYVDYLK
ncbi:MAG: dTDP-glucose 4,6-dehydratase [Flavobacteriales bacterium]|nr:dTDP-glucose 4,6-dehydratase [Flavobacteriales bacterium]